MTREQQLKLHKVLFDGVREDDMTRLHGISSYNRNYFEFNGRLLFGKSDDDNFTQWYWVKGDAVVPIGGSYASDDDKIIVDLAYT